jgi:hypothetical protein
MIKGSAQVHADFSVIFPIGITINVGAVATNATNESIHIICVSQ